MRSMPMPRRKIWGVDSSKKVTENLYQCVAHHYGTPGFWGRYLQTVSGSAEGLTRQEIHFLQNKGLKVIPIFSNFGGATGYRNGKVTAQNAVFHAHRLGIPKDTFLFANIEKEYDVDEAWIRGWVDSMYTSGFRQGLYCDPRRSALNQAYCSAVSKDSKVAEQTVIWSQEPTTGVTMKTNAPSFNPGKPNCKANVWIWQYGENAPDCQVDTNLLDNRLMDYLL